MQAEPRSGRTASKLDNDTCGYQSCSFWTFWKSIRFLNPRHVSHDCFLLRFSVNFILMLFYSGFSPYKAVRETACCRLLKSFAMLVVCTPRLWVADASVKHGASLSAGDIF